VAVGETEATDGDGGDVWWILRASAGAKLRKSGRALIVCFVLCVDIGVGWVVVVDEHSLR
jgi:hypothetical protein